MYPNIDNIEQSMKDCAKAIKPNFSLRAESFTIKEQYKISYTPRSKKMTQPNDIFLTGFERQ